VISDDGDGGENGENGKNVSKAILNHPHIYHTWVVIHHEHMNIWVVYYCGTN
jgi:hypothetical protein